MQNITLRSHVGEDGILHLDIPVGLTDAELEITVSVQPVDSPSEVDSPKEKVGRLVSLRKRLALCEMSLSGATRGTSRTGATGLTYLLDTNTCIGYLKGRAIGVVRLETVPSSDVFVCSIVKGELFYGAIELF